MSERSYVSYRSITRENWSDMKQNYDVRMALSFFAEYSTCNRVTFCTPHDNTSQSRYRADVDEVIYIKSTAGRYGKSSRKVLGHDLLTERSKMWGDWEIAFFIRNAGRLPLNRWCQLLESEWRSLGVYQKGNFNVESHIIEAVKILNEAYKAVAESYLYGFYSDKEAMEARYTMVRAIRYLSNPDRFKRIHADTWRKNATIQNNHAENGA